MSNRADAQLVMAYDCGTTSLKVVLADIEGRMLAEASERYQLSQSSTGHAEQSPDEMWNAITRGARSVLSSAGANPADVAALVFAATWKGIIPLDSDGRPLADAMIWLDSRAAEQAARLNDSAGTFVGTGQEYWPRLMWLKEVRPDIWTRARHIVGLNTYFKYRATGRLVTDPSDDFVRSPTASRDARFNDILDSAGLLDHVAKFPGSESSTARVGRLTRQAADELGLTANTHVFNGFSDLPAVTVGSGSGGFGDMHIYLGSSSWFARITGPDEAEEASASFELDSDRRGDLHGLQSACIAYDWAIDQLYGAEKRELGQDVHALVNNQVAETAPGADNVLATHWLTGEIPPLAAKNAKGIFLNLTPVHDRRHMVRAVMESIAFSHRMGLDRYRDAGVGELGRVRIVGGGATSDLWMQIFADILKVPVEVPASPAVSGARGALYAALIGLGKYDDYSTASTAVPVDRVFEPRPEYAPTYDRLYAVYTKLHPALSAIFTELNGEY